jgi:hypothetical protein
VRSQVLVSLLVSGVLGDEVEVFSADDEGTVHLGGNDGAGQDTATDGDETGEGALLVCGRRGSAFTLCLSAQFRSPVTWSRRKSRIRLLPPRAAFRSRFRFQCPISNRRIARTDVGSLNGGLGCSEAQSNVLVPSSASLSSSRRLGLGLSVGEDMGLLLISTLRLNSEFGGHDCGLSRVASRGIVVVVEPKIYRDGVFAKFSSCALQASPPT